MLGICDNGGYNGGNNGGSEEQTRGVKPTNGLTKDCSGAVRGG